jgi:hypothetical protein
LRRVAFGRIRLPSLREMRDMAGEDGAVIVVDERVAHGSCRSRSRRLSSRRDAAAA